MRILMLHQETPDPNAGEQGAGGAEVIVRDIIDGMRARGHTVEWMYHRDQASLLDEPWDVAHAVTIQHYIGMDAADRLQARGVPMVWTLMDYWPICTPRMCLTQGHSGSSCPAVRGVCDLSCGAAERPPDGWRVTMERARVVAMNQFAADIYERNCLHIDDVIEPGVDTDVWRPGDPDERDGGVVTSAAWAQMPWKGMATVAEAIRGAEYGVQLLSGIPRAKLPEILRRARVYLFPSLYEETFGMALCEARASGCVCIASDVAGARAQIQDGWDGLLVPPGDAGALRRTLDSVLGNYDWYRPMGEQARARVLAHNTLAHMLDRYEAAYVAAREDVRCAS